MNGRDMSPLALAFEQKSEGIAALLLLNGADATKVLCGKNVAMRAVFFVY